MPYIIQEDRQKFIPYLEKMPSNIPNKTLVELFISLGLRFQNPNGINIGPIIGSLPDYNIGDMNFIMTWLIHKAVEDRGLRYANLNDLVGVYGKALAGFLTFAENDAVEACYRCSQLEFVRRIVNPYEDTKIHVNGPVSQLERELNPKE